MAKIRKISAFVWTGIILLSFINKAQAQSWYEEERRTFYGGVIAGGNFTQVDGDRYAGYHNIGLNLGAIVYAQLAEHVAASIEILYSQKGSRSNGPQWSSSQRYQINKYNIKLNYAEVPIQINYFDKRKSHFGAGFSYSQLISSSEVVEANVPVVHHVTGATIDYEKDYPFRKFDVNFLLCGNLKLYKGLFLQARFQYSLLPVRKGIHPELGRAEQYNNMWALRLMYLFQ